MTPRGRDGGAVSLQYAGLIVLAALLLGSLVSVGLPATVTGRTVPALCSILHTPDACAEPASDTATSGDGQRDAGGHEDSRPEDSRHDGCHGVLGCTWTGVSGFGGGVWSGIKDTGSGLKNTVVHPIATGKGLVVQSSHDGMAAQADSARKSCQAEQWIRCAASSNCALIGPLCDLQDSVYDKKTIREAENGHWTKAGGRAAWNIGSLLIPTKVPGLSKAGQLGRAGRVGRTVVSRASPVYRQAMEDLATARRLRRDGHPGIRYGDARRLLREYTKLPAPERVELLRAMTPQELQDLELRSRKFRGGAHADLLATAPADVLAEMDLPNPKFTRNGTWWRFDGDLFHSGGPKPEDVMQGQIGDCWCVAAMGAVARSNPGLIEKMITKNPNGTYTVAFRDGKKTTVTSELPAAGAHVPRGGAGWPAIMEKAVADRYRGYDRIDGGADPAIALRMFAGSSSKDYLGALIPRAGRVRVAMNRGDAFVVSINKLPKALKAQRHARGILTRHAYMITDADPARDTLTLANPWGPDTRQVVLTRREIRQLGWNIRVIQAPTK